MFSKFGDLPQEDNEVTYARKRLPNRIYASKSFIAPFGTDKGFPTRYIHKVFDECDEPESNSEWEWETYVVEGTETKRKQLQLQVAKNAGVVRQIRLQQVPASQDATKLDNLLTLDRQQSTSLIELIKTLDSIPADGDRSVRVDEQLLHAVFSDPDTIGQMYSQDPARFRALIESDATAQDVIALQRRRKVVETMRSWLTDDEAFDAATADAGKSEAAWQQLLEDNPWVLGVGLGGQLFTSWSKEKLEQVTSGARIGSAGKRTDALLRTNGAIRSMAFAEIKHHRTPLLMKDCYRSACWGPSREVSGAVVQVQQTVRMAVRDLGEYIEDRAHDGARTGTGTFITQPRAFLIVGQLSQLQGDSGGANDDKVHSFELFRRNLNHPEIITFDELLARAEWHITLAKEQMEEAD